MKPAVVIVVGTRPEAIKMAPVWFALQRSGVFEPILVSTGQHREMLDQALAVFGLRPEIDLGLMEPGQTLVDLTLRVIKAMSDLLKRRKPSAVLVQGDTTTVLGSALAAFYEQIPIGHVEAGLRTYDYSAPWPEEMNRRLTDPISRWCFAPTDKSAANLRAERIAPEQIHVTGNTVVDALFWVLENLNRNPMPAIERAERCQIPPDFARQFLLRDASGLPNQLGRWIFVTGHRRESFGRGLENICQAISQLTIAYPDVGWLFPVHLNPNVQDPVRRMLGSNPRVALIPPVRYEDFVWLMNQCYFILSDSGGVQEEAPSLGKPVLVMRSTTERPEGLEAGTCRLVGTDPERIIQEATILLSDDADYRRRSALRNPYGDGRASDRIASVLAREISY